MRGFAIYSGFLLKHDMVFLSSHIKNDVVNQTQKGGYKVYNNFFL